jgi:hypothetical protein
MIWTLVFVVIFYWYFEIKFERLRQDLLDRLATIEGLVAQSNALPTWNSLQSMTSQPEADSPPYEWIYDQSLPVRLAPSLLAYDPFASNLAAWNG